MAYNDFVTNILNADRDAIDLGHILNDEPNKQIPTRLGRLVWTLATLNNRLDNFVTASNQQLADNQSAHDAQMTAHESEHDAQIADFNQTIQVAKAAGAGAQGWTTELVVEDGLTQKKINDKNAYFYATVADMAADTKLKAGKAVITHGYYTPNDGGGARYLISSTATDYSIPVANGLHAVFADSFDIRKFGIRDSATLDQTTEIQRMVNYADSRIYEIDFLNFSLMSPKTTVNYRTGSGIGRGMAFSFVHKLKNLTIANDKTKTLQQGDCCIFFLPKVDSRGTFELDNVTFDPFVADYKITAGDGDGYMHGFSAAWHKDFATGWPANQRFMTGYSIVYNNINFVSPAVSYNLAVNFWCREILATNIIGEYWGLYIWHWCDRLYAENVHGVFRDDLHANANPKRTLVTNLFQEEQEVGGGGFEYTQTRQEFKNISCIKKTGSSWHSAIVRQGMGKPTLKEFVADTVKGQIRWYMGKPTTQSVDYHISKAIIKNCNEREFIFWCGIDSLKVYDCILKDYINSYLYTFNDVYFQNVTMPTTAPFLGGIVNKFLGVNCDFTSEFGLIRIYPTIFNDIKLINPTVTRGWLISGFVKKVIIYGGNIKDNYFSRLIELADDGDTTPVPITVRNLDFDVSGSGGGNLIYANGVKVANAKVQNNGFKAKPNFVLGSGGTLVYEYNSPVLTASKTYDPPSLPTNSQQSIQVIISGITVGTPVIPVFDQPLQGTRMWAEVTSTNTVTVYHRNDTGATVDLASGTLTVKII